MKHLACLACALTLACSGGGDPPVTPVDAPSDPDAVVAIDAAAPDAADPDAAVPPDGRPLVDARTDAPPPPFDGPIGTTCGLGVERVGLGSGTVVSAPAGINCGAACRAEYPCGTTVTLTAIPAGGSRFVAWGVGCTGGGASCTLTLTTTLTFVTANFTTP